tara:strand:+ start:712 stop:828 length:117 start_codon:yes stop_codon:yes gene_type:complete
MSIKIKISKQIINIKASPLQEIKVSAVAKPSGVKTKIK